MLNAYQIADLLCALYDGMNGKFDFVESGSNDSGVCWASARRDGIDYVFLRGSVTAQDWLRDGDAMLPVECGSLGRVHPGFLAGMEGAWGEIKAHTLGPWVVSGHSLGAARAAILSGLMKRYGKAPLKRFEFGEPKPGFSGLADYLSDVPAEVYRNGNATNHDLVTDLPLTFPPEEYVHSAPLTFVTAEPPQDIASKLGIFAWHHMPLYREALAPK